MEGASAPSIIPCVIHRIWVGSPMPDVFVEYGREWQRLHPHWAFIEWGDHNRPTLFNEPLYVHAERYVPLANVGQFRSDILRLEILWHLGGLYVDTDFEPRKPIDDLLAGAELFATWEVDGRWIANGLMGARPHHSFIRRLIQGLPDSVGASPGVTPNRTSGPQYLTRMWRELKPDMRIAPSRLFYPYGWNELHRRDEEFPDVYAVHLWANQRRKRGIPL